MPPKRKRDSALERLHPSPERPSRVPYHASPSLQCAFSFDSEPPSFDQASSSKQPRRAIPAPALTSEANTFALAANNLLRLRSRSITAGTDTSTRSGSSSETSSRSTGAMTTRAAELNRLSMADIYVDRGASPPGSIADLISRLRGTERVSSPKASEAVQKAALAREGNEEKSKRILGDFLGLADHAEGGHGWTAYHTNLRLSEEYLPNSSAGFDSRRMKSAEPDICNGYRRGNRAARGTSVPFAREEENWIASKQVLNPRTKALCSMTLHSELHFPFFTVQCRQHQAMSGASLQGARDGAVVNEHLRSVFRTAQGVTNAAEPDVLKTVHFSATCEGNVIQTWVHWFYTADYNMERIKMYPLDDEEALAKYRRFLRNLEDWAHEERLTDIKSALHEIAGRSIPPADVWVGLARGGSLRQNRRPPLLASALAPSGKRGPGRPRKHPQTATASSSSRILVRRSSRLQNTDAT